MREVAALYGKHLWVWYVDQSGGAEGVITTAKATGADGVIVKCADGTTPWPQFAQSVAALKAAGLAVGAWAYVYPDQVQTQAKVIADACAGADYLVIDAEAPFEAPAMATAAEALGTALRVLLSELPIGLTTFAVPHLHPAFPYAAFARWVDCMLPQVYWADAGMDPRTMLSEAVTGVAQYGKPVIPIGQAYPRATAGEVALFAARAAELALQGISYWNVQHLQTEPGLAQAIKSSQVYTPPHKTVKPKPHGLDAAQEKTITEIKKLVEELKTE